MKENWEPTGQMKLLEYSEIEELINTAIPNKKLLSAEPICNGLSNTNYKINIQGLVAPYVLRLYQGSKEITEKELAIANLVKTNVPVANFIHSDTSCRIINQPWAVIEWKEGILLRDVLRAGSKADIVSAAASVGSTLAQIHQYTFSESGFFGEGLCIENSLNMNGERFLAFMEQSLFQDPCGTWLGEELAQAVWIFCKKYSPLLTDYKEQPVLAHSDFNGLNILVQDQSNGYSVSAVLDWEFSFSWNRYVDIGNVLRYENTGSLFETHFIQAYTEYGGKLHEQWRLLSGLEDLVALCDMLNHSTRSTPIRMNDLRSLIERTIQIG